jgi:hypothetical protein
MGGHATSFGRCIIGRSGVQQAGSDESASGYPFKCRIRRLADLLGLNWTARILSDYLAIFEAVCGAAGPCPEPTFAACADPGTLPAGFWRRLEAG